MSARDRLNSEDIAERYELLKGAVEGLADRIELHLADEFRDDQAISEDTLWHLDVLTGRGWPRGRRWEDQR